VRTVLALCIPARPEYLVLGRLALAGVARVVAIDPDALGDLKLALTEACANAIRHAYAGSDGEVEIRFEVADDASYMAIEVSDHGPGFGDGKPGGESSDGDGEGGLGLAIIRAVSDSVELRPREDGTGSCVRFLKRLA
jgi:serine/threonine-protein kinase RsbW